MKSIIHITVIVAKQSLRLCVHEVREDGEISHLIPIINRQCEDVFKSSGLLSELLHEAEEKANIEIKRVDLLAQTPEEMKFLQCILEHEGIDVNTVKKKVIQGL